MNKPAILFVCSQNRCRSLAAEGVFRYIVESSQLPWQVDSAGLEAAAGCHAEALISQAAALRGYNLSKLQSRPLRTDDFHCFDYILAVNQSIQTALLKQAPQLCMASISLLPSHAIFFNASEDIDYPHSSDLHVFSAMLDRIEDACLGLFHFIREKTHS